MGGVGRITGTLIGAVILGLIKSGFTFIGVDSYIQDIIKGAYITHFFAEMKGQTLTNWRDIRAKNALRSDS
ncbi:hypothetical protein ACJ8PQ_19775, partial [Serratia sp. CY74664]